MNYCPRCGAPLTEEQNFCRDCGLDLRARAVAEGKGWREPTPMVVGVSSNAAYHLTQEGLFGVRILSPLAITFCVLLPLPLLAIIGFALQPDSDAVYLVGWLVTSALLYDEVKWRRFRKLRDRTIEHLATTKFWMLRWHSIKRANWDGSTLTTSTPDRLKTTITFDSVDSATVEGTLSAWGVPLRRKPMGRPSRILGSFLALVLVTFVASQAILIAAAVLPFFPGEEQVYSSALHQLEGNLTRTTLVQQFELIYRNNLQVATANMLPGLGTLTLGAASYNTGRVIQVIGLNQHVPPILVVLSLYLYPHSWVEELSYPITTSAGIMLLTRWRRVSPRSLGHRVDRGSVKFALALGGVALQLTVAGFFEVVEPGLGIYTLLLWVPVAIAVILIIMRMRQSKPTAASPYLPSTGPKSSPPMATYSGDRHRIKV